MNRTLQHSLLFGTLTALAAASPAFAKSPVISLSDSIEPLRKQFNAGVNRPRVVALLSPTSKAGMDGSDALAASLLNGAVATGPDVIIIWVNLLHGDTADEADRAAARFAGGRTTQYYDAKGRAAWSFGAATLGEQRKGVWNTYVYYLPGALWSIEPPRPEDWLHEMAGPRQADPLRYRGGAKLRAGLRRWLSDSSPGTDQPTEYPSSRSYGSIVSDSATALPEPRPVRPAAPRRTPPPSVPRSTYVEYNGPFEDRNIDDDSTGADTWAQPTKSCSKSTAKPITAGSFESSISPSSTNTTRSARSVAPSPVSPLLTDSSRNYPNSPARPSSTTSSNVSTVASRSTPQTSNGNLLPLEPLPTNGRSSPNTVFSSSARASGPSTFELTATAKTPVGGTVTVKTKPKAPV